MLLMAEFSPVGWINEVLFYELNSSFSFFEDKAQQKKESTKKKWVCIKELNIKDTKMKWQQCVLMDALNQIGWILSILATQWEHIPSFTTTFQSSYFSCEKNPPAPSRLNTHFQGSSWAENKRSSSVSDLENASATCDVSGVGAAQRRVECCHSRAPAHEMVCIGVGGTEVQKKMKAISPAPHQLNGTKGCMFKYAFTL